MAPHPSFESRSIVTSCQSFTIAANCVHQKYNSKAKRPRDVLLVSGAYDLDELFLPGIGSFSSSTSEIIVHPDWKPFATSFDADIALLISGDLIPFTSLIRPICLWETWNDPIPDQGYIAGWGLSATSSKEYESVPKQLKIPIYQGEDCLLNNPLFTQVSSKRTIWGGSRNGAGPCMGEIIKSLKSQ